MCITNGVISYVLNTLIIQKITEILDVLLTYIENKSTKDQFYLLLLEPRCAEILYALLLEKIFSTELREKVLRVIISRSQNLCSHFLIFLFYFQLLINILKTDRAYEKSKVRLYLHDVGFQGLLMLMQGQPSSLEMTHLLTDIILSRGYSDYLILLKAFLIFIFKNRSSE